MSIELATPTADELPEAVDALRRWQRRDEVPFQIHPGDLGWHHWDGPAATAADVRTWRRDGELAAVGFLDTPDVLRLGIAPELRSDEDLAARIAADLLAPDADVLPAGEVSVEAHTGVRLKQLLADAGWADAEPWTQLRRDLTDPVELPPGLRVEVVDGRNVSERTAVHRSAFGSDRFTDERWRTVAASPAYAGACCLLGYDEDDVPVAAITVWSAGEGVPGLIEPMGVHADHRGRGFGTAITLAGAARLREMGASSADVATPSSNTGGVATYVAAGMSVLGEVHDKRRG
ncbi:GNAT family N-acetyltransferase [Barrientosiimonas humi]|uniref:GNAT family N-acetyltransferase n=1 Tax=Barrientosiimonas humi TaxID=999931 RepID=UPI00370D5FBE